MARRSDSGAPPGLAIRADASSTMGVGHVMRCLALAQAWRRRGGAAEFLCAGLGEALARRIAEAGFTVVPLPGRCPDPADLSAVLAATRPGQWIVLDGYHFGPDYQQALRESGRRLCLLDDYAHHPRYHADVLLNQNPTAQGQRYSLPDETVLLGGLRYCLLREEFLGPRRRRARASQRLLVTLGGSDPDNVTGLVLEAAARLKSGRLRTRVVVGPANPHLRDLEDRLSRLGLDAELLVDPDMARQMRWADLAVTAAGVTCWELARMGVPMLALTLQDNQGKNAEALARAGAGLDLGLGRQATAGGLADALRTVFADAGLRRAMSLAGPALVDGRGAARVVELLRSLDSGGRPRLRQARPEDCWPIWLLSNNPTVRAWSHNPAPIPYESHEKWFQDRLASPDAVLFVLDVAGAIMGQIRYERGGDEALISFSVSPAFRGRGLGLALLRRSAGKACAALGVRFLRGEVRTGNTASLRCFCRAGFVQSAGFENPAGDFVSFTRPCSRISGGGRG